MDIPRLNDEGRHRYRAFIAKSSGYLINLSFSVRLYRTVTNRKRRYVTNAFFWVAELVVVSFERAFCAE